MDIGSRRELFVDYTLIDRLDGARLKLHEPQPGGIAVKYDDPWARSGAYSTVIKDGDLYRLYFKGVEKPGADDAQGQSTVYAESRDGIHWQKPNLGLYEVHGSKNNNVVYYGDGPSSVNFSPFVDTKPGVPADERYKALAGLKATGLLAFHSHDGIHWRRADQPPVQPPTPEETRYDSQNVAFWSEHESCYCCYFRVFVDKVRTIARTTSQDFVDWTEPVLMSFGNTPLEHLYINQTHPYFRAPHIYVALPARFMKDRKVLADEEGTAMQVNQHLGVGYWQDCAEGLFMTSRGGNRYHRTFMEGFVKPGLDRRNWVSRCNYPGLGVVPTGPGEMSFYLKRHNQQPTAHIERMVLRTDGFSSLTAPYAGGEMVSKPFTFSGSELEINYATGAGGHLSVELQDEAGDSIRGYSESDCGLIIGDEIERLVEWQGSPDLAVLAGQRTRLRVILKDANLYSFRFR